MFDDEYSVAQADQKILILKLGLYYSGESLMNPRDFGALFEEINPSVNPRKKHRSIPPNIRMH